MAASTIAPFGHGGVTKWKRFAEAMQQQQFRQRGSRPILAQAHEPQLVWQVTGQDALDVLGTLSMIHRRFDTATLNEGK